MVLLVWSWLSGARADDGVPITAARANGSYKSFDNEIDILTLKNGTLKVQFDLTNKYVGPMGPTAATGASLGEARLVKDTAIYFKNEFAPCRISIKFLPKNQLEVTELESGGCTFGARTSAAGIYRKLKSGVPLNLVPGAGEAPEAKGAGPSAALLAARLQTSATTLAFDRSDAAALDALASAALTKLTPLRARQKQLDTKPERALFNKHLEAGASALPRAKFAMGKAKTDALASARTELQLARSQGSALDAKLVELRKTEAEMERLLTVIVTAAAEANASAKDAQSISASTKQGLSDAKEAEAHATTAAATAKSALALAALGTKEDFSARKLRAEKDDAGLRAQIASANALLLQQATLLTPNASLPTSAANATAGTTEVPVAEVKQRYGETADVTMGAHPEIVKAMQRLDRDADVLAMGNDNRAVRTNNGRELLLMCGRTCRACGAIQYWIVWEAATGMLAFERADTDVPVYGKPDGTARAVLDQFVKAVSNF